MFSQRSQPAATSKEQKEKGQKLPDELWVAKIVKSKKGSPGKRKLRGLSGDALKTLDRKKAAVFVSVDSRDYEPSKIDAMLAALCRAGMLVDLIIVDSNVGFNKVEFDCSKLGDQELQNQVFPLGEKRAKQWIQECKHIIDRYRYRYPEQVYIRYCACKDTGDGIGTRIEDEPEFDEAKGKINVKLQEQELLSALQLTIQEHFRNQEASEIKQHNSEMYLKTELPIYYILATKYKYIIYTSEESPVLRYTRKLVDTKERAKYLQIDFSTISCKRLSLGYVEEKINHGGGIEGNISLENFNITPDQPSPPPLPILKRHHSDPNLSLVPKSPQKPRSSSLNGNCSFFSSKSPEQQTTAPSSPLTPTIDNAGEAFCAGNYQDALSILIQIDYSKLTPDDQASYDKLLAATKSAMEYREGILKSQVKELLIQRHNGNGNGKIASTTLDAPDFTAS